MINGLIQKQLEQLRKRVCQVRAGDISNVNNNWAKEDSLSKAIRTEKDGKIFMAELKNAKDRAR